MTAEVFTQKGAGASTHAIVIGVGHYPHLPGGASNQKYPDPEGMEQLGSPPASARLFARWLIESYDCEQAPLRSVSLLVSEKNPIPLEYSHKGHSTSVPVVSATMPAIVQALQAWRARGDKHPDSKLIFYFCGHGISAGTELALLAEDFGANPAAALAGALDFRRFHYGMDECKARHQVYFVDACRAASELLKNNPGNAGNPVFTWSGAVPPPGGKLRLGPVFYSTLAGAPAYSRKKDPTVFTAVLIDALSGAGTTDDDGPWQVKTTRLLDALDFYMLEASTLLSMPQHQIPSSDWMALLSLNTVATPSVPVVVKLDRPDAHAAAVLRCENGSSKHVRSKPHGDPWRFKAYAGTYNFHADFKAGTFSVQSLMDEPVRPPYWRKLMK